MMKVQDRNQRFLFFAFRYVWEAAGAAPLKYHSWLYQRVDRSYQVTVYICPSLLVKWTAMAGSFVTIHGLFTYSNILTIVLAEYSRAKRKVVLIETQGRNCDWQGKSQGDECQFPMTAVFSGDTMRVLGYGAQHRGGIKRCKQTHGGFFSQRSSMGK